MDNNGFADVTWEDAGVGAASQAPDGTYRTTERPSIEQTRSQSGRQEPAPKINDDQPGIASFTLECDVTAPLKEGDGTKDSYVSYLITTNVSFGCLAFGITLTSADEFPILSEVSNHDTTAFHRFRLPI